MANKFTNYMFLMGGFLLVFYFLGLLQGTTLTGSFITLLLNPENLKTSGLVLTTGSIIAGVGLAIGANRLANFQADMVILVALLPLLFGFGWDFLQLFLVVKATASVFATLFFSPLLVVYVLTVIEWWRGVTT